MRDLSFVRGGRAGANRWRVIELYVAKKGRVTILFFVNIAVHFKKTYKTNEIHLVNGAFRALIG